MGWDMLVAFDSGWMLESTSLCAQLAVQGGVLGCVLFLRQCLCSACCVWWFLVGLDGVLAAFWHLGVPLHLPGLSMWFALAASSSYGLGSPSPPHGLRCPGSSTVPAWWHCFGCVVLLWTGWLFWPGFRPRMFPSLVQSCSLVLHRTGVIPSGYPL